MWCSAGEEKRERGEEKKGKGKRGEGKRKGKGERKEGKGNRGRGTRKEGKTLYYIKKKEKKGGYLYEFFCIRIILLCTKCGFL